MLRNINPILSPNLLHALRAMGHGDEIVIADANFPAEALGLRVERADSTSATTMVQAIAELMPLDSFSDHSAYSMQVVGEPSKIPEIVEEFQKILDDSADIKFKISSLERYAFYERAKLAYLIVVTGERRIYGNLILKKGIIQD